MANANRLLTPASRATAVTSAFVEWEAHDLYKLFANAVHADSTAIGYRQHREPCAATDAYMYLRAPGEPLAAWVRALGFRQHRRTGSKIGRSRDPI